MSEPLFRERQSPGPLSMLVGAVFGLVLGLITIPLSDVLAIVVAVLGAVGVPLIMILSSPVVSVSADRVRAGRASIEPAMLGVARVLDREQMQRVMGPKIDARAFRCTRGWITEGVEVPVVDPEDPTPAWVISLRRPEEFAAALAAAQAQRTAA